MGVIYDTDECEKTGEKFNVEYFVSYFRLNSLTESLWYELFRERAQSKKITRHEMREFSIQIWPRAPDSLADIAKLAAVDSLTKEQVYAAKIPLGLKQELARHYRTRFLRRSDRARELAHDILGMFVWLY